MAEGARRIAKLGFGVPDSKGRIFPPNLTSDEYGPAPRSGWSSERRPRGVLKRKGQVVGGYAASMPAARVGGADVIERSDFFERRGFEDVNLKRMKVESVAESGAARRTSGGYGVSNSGMDYLGEEGTHVVAGRSSWGARTHQLVPKMLQDKRMDIQFEANNEVIKVGRGGVLKYRPANKVVVSNEKSAVKIGAEGHRKSFEDMPYAAGKCERVLTAREREPLDELVSVALSKDLMHQKENPPLVDEVVREKRYFPKRKLDSKEIDHQLDGKSEDDFKLEASGSARKTVGAKKINRGSEKQKVREQIKSILLNAGWKIELRPRKNRDYEDSVYVSPQGTGYWSITKAYDAFQAQVKETNDIGNLNVDNPSKKSIMPGRNDKNISVLNGPTSALPSVSLSILKRNVVNKRSCKKDPKDKTEKPLGWMIARANKKSMMNLNISHPSINENHAHFSEGHCLSEGKSKAHVGLTLLPRNVYRGPNSNTNDCTPYDGKRTLLAWLIDLETIPEHGKVKYMNKRRTRALLEGWVTRDGIHCSCCSKILSVLKFETHAGSKLRQPYQNIFVESSGISLSQSSGISLLQCLLSAWRSQEKCKGSGFSYVDVSNIDQNDDICGICGDGGDLICCGGCPSSFHISCLAIERLPSGDWHCSNCTCKFCGEVPDTISNSASISELLTCYQCQAKYHGDCLPELDVMSDEHSGSHLSFCGLNCKMIYEKLQNLLGLKHELDSGLSWSLIQRSDDSSTYPPDLAQRAECNAKVAVALEVMNDCFLPIVDQGSGVNLITNIVFSWGSNLHRLNFNGVYTFILEREDEIISAASIRISGPKFAEMLFIGTCIIYRHRGMCNLLLNAIESALSSLNIEKLVTPAIPALANTWSASFGFRSLNGSLLREMKSTNMVAFPSMGLLVKTLPKEKDTTGGRGSSAIGASHHRPATHVSSLDRSRSDSACENKSRMERKKLGNSKIEGEVELPSGDATQDSTEIAEDASVSKLSFDGVPATCATVDSGKLIEAAIF